MSRSSPSSPPNNNNMSIDNDNDNDDHDTTFREPNPGFQALLSRWKTQDTGTSSLLSRTIPSSPRKVSATTASAPPRKVATGTAAAATTTTTTTTVVVAPPPLALADKDNEGNATSPTPPTPPPLEPPGRYVHRPSVDAKKQRGGMATSSAVHNEGGGSGDQQGKEEASPSDRISTRHNQSKSHLKSSSTKSKMATATAKAGKRPAVLKTKNVYQQPLPTDAKVRIKSVDKSPLDRELIYKALAKNFVFSDLKPDALLPLVSAFEPKQFTTDETIIRQGDPGDYFYVIKSGSVTFHVHGTQVGKARAGASFGELSLLYTCPRAATVVAAEPTLLFRVDQNTFRYILQSQTQQSQREKVELLQKVDFLKHLDDADLRKMTRVMTPRVYRKDEVIVRKGDHGDAFYILAEGNVLVKDISVGCTVYQDQTLGPGEYFGERALATSEPRAANVVGLTKGVAFSIDRATFEKVLGTMSHLVLKAQDARRLAGVKVLAPLRLDALQFAALAANIEDRRYNAGQQIVTLGLVTPSALYFVREGRVEVNVNGQLDHVDAGGYFGEPSFGSQPNPVATYSATASVDSVCGVLTLMDCRDVFDVSLLQGKERVARSTSAAAFVPETKVRLDELERHAILGEGTFGQVQLVTERLSDGSRRPYALKIQAKADLESEGQIAAVIREKEIMSQLNHPFLVRLVKTFQDESFVYILLPLLQGGELFSVLHDRDELGMPESQASFYALCVADALAWLHSIKVVFRDLKPENVLIDHQGYPVLIDFGFAKTLTDKTYTLCGTPGYLPPEVVMTRGHNFSADHWSLGILIYEMVTGLNPFFYEGMDQMSLFESIVQDDYDDPKDVSASVIDLIRKLLVKDPIYRLGSLARGERDILQHRWFNGLDLPLLRLRQSEHVPWVPLIKDPLDTSNFDDWSHLEDKTSKPQKALSAKSSSLFESF